MGKILFVNPPLSLRERYGILAATGGTTTAPLGLCCLAAVVRSRGHETGILDAEALKLGFEETATRIVERRPDYVGITAVTISVANAAKVAARLRALRFAGTVIVGGPHVTAVPRETMERFEPFDIAVIGEGEATVVELLRALDEGRPLDDVAGLAFRRNGSVQITKRRAFIRDLDSLPMPAFDLLPDLLKHYKTAVFSLGREPSTAIVTSRGCVGRCIFCDRKVFGNVTRGFSARYIVDMMKHLQAQFGIKEFDIADDAFVVLRKRTFEFCQMLIDERLDVTWSCAARVDLVTPEMLRLMKKAGCWQIAYGIESGSQRILDFIDKRVTLEQIETTVRLTDRIGIRTRGFFMIGHPTESEETIRQTIAFAKRIPVREFQITAFTPLPGCEAHQIALEYGSFSTDWAGMNLWDVTFVPTGLTQEKLQDYQRRAFREFYLRPQVAWSYLKLVRNPANALKLLKGGLVVLKLQLSPRGVRAVGSALGRVGGLLVRSVTARRDHSQA